MPVVPDTRYLPLESGLLAYQSIGKGPRTIVLVHEVGVHLDLIWTDPTWLRQWARFDGQTRGLQFQPRGIGLSEPVARLATPQEIASDVIAVMDAEGASTATLLGIFMTAPGVLACAAMHPQRVDGVVVWNPLAQGPYAPGRPERDLWPDDTAAEEFAAAWLRAAERWGTGEALTPWDPVIATPRNVRMSAMMERTAASPRVARQYLEAGLRADVVDALPLIHVPVVVRWTPSTRLPEATARAVADLAPRGVFEHAPPSHPGLTYSESWVHVSDRIMEMVLGEPPGPDRHHASLLFTDVVASTERAAAMGDAAWSALRIRLEDQIRARVEADGGDLVKLLGDGSLSVFPSTRVAIHCAHSIHEDARALGLDVRAGVHAGEIDHRDGDIGGLAVHVAARVAAKACDGQTLTTQAAVSLASDGETRFASVGEHVLKGVPGRWELFAASPPDSPATAAGLPPRPRIGDRAVVAMARRLPRASRALLRLEERLRHARSPRR